MTSRGATRDESIGVGDLVQVVRWGCCNGRIGYTFIVTSIRHSTSNARCGFCKTPRTGLAAFDNDAAPFLVEMLKRIPPLGELEEEKVKEDIREPA